jgi:hypothetical protein
MWSYEHTAEGDVSADAIWRLWVEVENWGGWNSDIAEVALDGPFEVGSTIAMTSRRGDTVGLPLVGVEPGETFVDQADLGDVVVTTTHQIDRLDGRGVRIVYRTEITGPAAEEVGPVIGSRIVDHFPETVAALIALAAE